MTADEQPQGAGPKIEVALEELHTGADQLHALAEETTSKLVPSGQTLETSASAWRGLRSAAAYAAYAEFEAARGKAAEEAIGRAAGNVGHAAERYGRTDAANANSIDRIT